MWFNSVHTQSDRPEEDLNVFADLQRKLCDDDVFFGSENDLYLAGCRPLSAAKYVSLAKGSEDLEEKHVHKSQTQQHTLARVYK